MKRYNISIVYDKNEENILMCYRTKDPYKDMYNLVGGKIEENETDLEAAYRELNEETGINKEDIKLVHLMNFDYKISAIELQVFVGKLNKDVTLIEEFQHLYWLPIDDDYFSLTKFAGEGNIGHMLEQIKIHHDKIFS